MEKKKPKDKGKLPSGSVRIQAYWYTDMNGKRHYKSFTASSRKEAKRLADEWRLTKKEDEPRDTENKVLTVQEAVTRYIELKSEALSPSTVAAYEKNLRNHLSGAFGRKELKTLASADIQLWISELARKGLTPKTIKNIYGLFRASLDMFEPDLHIRVTLPAPKRPELYCPSDQDIKRLLDTITDPDLEIAILLAAFGPLRRGEICALESSDIRGNVIRVSKSKVMGPDKTWIIKQPKTLGSYRDVEFPSFVIQRIKGIKGPIIKCTPSRISDQFAAAVKQSGLPKFRFHDLRHYAASIMHAIGVPDQYILDRGGWSSDSIMKSVYRNVIDLEKVKQTRKINEHFEKLSPITPQSPGACNTKCNTSA